MSPWTELHPIRPAAELAVRWFTESDFIAVKTVAAHSVLRKMFFVCRPPDESRPRSKIRFHESLLGLRTRKSFG